MIDRKGKFMKATNSSPVISVVIPTCGRPTMLLDCVASIISGRYDNFEILVIDQDPKSQLQDRLSRHFPGEIRLRYYLLDQAGASRSRNLGIEEAKGGIVAFIDDDAIADPIWLKAICDIMTEASPPDLIAGRIEPLWPGKRPEWYPYEREFLLGLYNIGDEVRLLPPDDQPISANMAGVRRVIQALGGFDERLGFNYFRKHAMLAGEDAMMGKRARQAQCLIYYLPQAKVFHRISKTKLTRRYFLRRHFWEGVTEITLMNFLNQLGTGKLGHLKSHSKTIVKSLIVSLLPGLRGRSMQPRAACRMLALSQAAQSLGVIYSLLTLRESTTR
jgi:glucosyl-dolichyl phosphate glucuronosyltransferase